ncbi:MAG: DUF58 domain-containing protein [Bacteroidales bacterium]|nr:DUF58 domain-containing protein [Bacteroidales bacterium]
METSDLIKKVRKIEIKTRRISNQIFSGHYHSAFKGRGMAFSEVREYQYGDDIRSIDWNVTARFNHPFIKIFDEERELTVMLIIDVSSSNIFGTVNSFKNELITEIAAVLAFSAIQNNDKVGVIFFSDKVEKFITPKKGTHHILRIIRELINFVPENKGTSITEGLKYFTNVIKKRCTAFVLSDFIDNNFDNALRIANKKHDVIAVRISDPREKILPAIGLMKIKDAETGADMWIDSSDAGVRRQYEQWWAKKEMSLRESFKKSGVDTVNISTGEDYVRPLTNLFRLRESRY